MTKKDSQKRPAFITIPRDGFLIYILLLAIFVCLNAAFWAGHMVRGIANEGKWPGDTCKEGVARKEKVTFPSDYSYAFSENGYQKKLWPDFKDEAVKTRRLIHSIK